MVVVVVPLLSAVPPDAAAYQSTVDPFAAVAETEIAFVLELHINVSLPVGVAGNGLIVAVTAVRLFDTHVVPAILVSA